MANLKFTRPEGYVGGGTGTKFTDENFKICPMCHTHDPHWYGAGELHGVGGASVFEKSFGYIRCDKCKAIYKHKMIDLLKFTDRNVLRTPFGRRIDVGSLDVNDIEFEVYDAGMDETAAKYVGQKFTVRMMNADILRVEDGHTPNPSGEEAYAESRFSSGTTYIKDMINNDTARDIQERKDKIASGVCPMCGAALDEGINFCASCGYQIQDTSTREICYKCGSTLNEQGLCPLCNQVEQAPSAPAYQEPKPVQQASVDSEKSSIKNGLMSLIFGIVSIYTLLFPFGIVSIVLGKKAQGTKGEKLAKIGKILSIVSFALIPASFMFGFMLGILMQI